MSISRFRHAQTNAPKLEERFRDMLPTDALWEGSNMIACNDLYVAVPWSKSGGVATFLNEKCTRALSPQPVVFGQAGAIIDIKFNPFNRILMYTASEDGSIFGWRIPDGGYTENCSSPTSRLQLHSKKCGILSFHPSAKNVMASAGMDKLIHLWDTELEKPQMSASCPGDYATGLDWNLDGSQICFTSRDSKIHIYSVGSQNPILSQTSHKSSRSQRCVWAKRQNKIITFGVDTMQRRQLMIWDPRNMSAAESCVDVDDSSSAMIPIFDEDTSLLYVGSKGEGGFRCYELMNGALVRSHEYVDTTPIRGMCAFPKWSLNVKECEIARIYQLTKDELIPLRVILPRKNCDEVFQEDVYPNTFSNIPALTSYEYFKRSKRLAPKETDLRARFDGASPLSAQKEVRPLSTIKKPPVSLKEKYGAKEDEKCAQVSNLTATHVDPCALPPENTEKLDKIRKLSIKVKEQRAEIEELRAVLLTKENEMMDTLSELQQLL